MRILIARGLSILTIIAVSAGCGREFSGAPLGPTQTLSAPVGLGGNSISWEAAVVANVVGLPADNHLPGPTNFTFGVNGSTVVLGWQAAAGNVNQYVIEAGSGPGLANVAVFGTGSPGVTLTVTNVPPGLYYARVRAIVDGQLTAASNEIVVPVGGMCPGVVTPTSAYAPRTGAILSFSVTTGCAWTAVSNSQYVSVLSGATGVGNGLVSVGIAANQGATRVGSLRIAGQDVTITQGAASVHAGFELFDPATQIAATTECRINTAQSRCVLRSGSFTFGPTAIVNYAWTVQYTYGGEIKTFTQSGPSPEFAFGDVCGLNGADAAGALQPLYATLTVTDTVGDTATAVSGSFGQPPLQLRLYTCP
jgi:hypothetical protein